VLHGAELHLHSPILGACFGREIHISTGDNFTFYFKYGRGKKCVQHFGGETSCKLVTSKNRKWENNMKTGVGNMLWGSEFDELIRSVSWLLSGKSP
jgi:hypothetical protein